MRLVALLPEQLDDEQAALYEQIAGGKRASGPFRLREDDGSLTGPFNAMLHAPSVGRALSELGEAIRYRTKLGNRLREVAILTVAVVRKSPFEWYAHERVARSIGMTDLELDTIRRLDPAGLPEEERVVLRLARTMARNETVDTELFHHAVDTFGTGTLVEIAVLVGYYELLASMMDLFEIGAPHGEAD